MSQTNEIVKPKLPFEILGVGELPWSKLPPLAQGWLTMAANKVVLFESLTKQELAVQTEINKVDPLLAVTGTETVEQLNDRLKQIQDAIAAGSSVYATAKAERLHFTSILDEKLIQPAMSFEKRSDVIIAGAKTKEVTFRQLVVKKNDEQKNRGTEVANLKAHITNEHARIAVQYRTDLSKMIFDAYATALRGKTPVDQIPAYKTAVIGFMRDVKLSPFTKYPRVHVNDADAMEIFKAIPAYNSANDFAAAEKELDDKFAMYEHDLKNAEAAIQAQENELKQTTANANQQLQQDMATTDLMASAGEIVSTGAPKIKVNMEVVVENSEQWEMAVLSNYIRNYMDCQQFITAKERQNRKLAQYATALGKLATKNNQSDIKPNAVYNGLTLQVITK